jgi:hypothetical protein
MKTVHDRNREGLESVLKRVAKLYATGHIGKDNFDEFDRTVQESFKLIDIIEEECGDVEA